MQWKFNPIPSPSGVPPNTVVPYWIRGTRFTLRSDNSLSISDYQKRRAKGNEMVSQFAIDVIRALGRKSTNRIRIRANGEVYAWDSPRSSLYVGMADLGHSEVFPGYLNLKTSYDFSTQIPQLFAGPQAHDHPGERWTIPEGGFARRKGKLGHVGKKKSKGVWDWSKTSHINFIRKMRDRLFLKDDPTIRFYITCDGLIVTPIPHNHFGGYGIDFYEQYEKLEKTAPKAARSVQERYNRSRGRGDDRTHLLFAMGHIDDLMDGDLPEPE